MSNAKTPAQGIVLFMVDQLSAKWLEACMQGAADVKNFKRLAERGVTFANAITSNPVCCPARATIATGLTTRQHGVLENGYELDPALPTFMQVLQKAGWRTGAFGKVHLWPHYKALYPEYKPYGFDETCITEDPRGGQYLDWVRREHPDHFETVLGTIWAQMIPEFSRYGRDKEDMAARIRDARQKEVWKCEKYPLSHFGAYVHPFPEQVSQTCWITARGLDFLKSLSADQPFFAQISYVQPHSPFNAPEYCLELVDESRIPEPAPPAWMDDPRAPVVFKRRYHRRASREQEQWGRMVYFADIVHLDRQLGKVLDALAAAGRLDSTHVIFLSDHGEMLGDHSMHGKEDKHYDACIRVPLMIAGPRVAGRSTVCDAMVQLEDVCPTILDIAGLCLPPLPTTGPNAPKQMGYPVLPGRTLLDLGDGEVPDNWRAAAYSGSYNAIWSTDPCDWAQTIRIRNMRYTYYPDGAEQLFDLANDPDEQHNLVDDGDWAEKVNELRFRLMHLIIMQDYPRTRRELFALGVH
ncbi:MAG: sulfatase family protein [Planctomycetota bacterium]|jgi:arylsulfatase A-like enzyme